MEQKPLIMVGLVIALSACATPHQQGVTAYNAGEYDKAAAQWRADALAGEPNAQYNLGLLWQQGLGSTPKNPKEAAAWFLKAARQGQAQAMVELAKYQLDTNHPDAALSWLNMAARWNESTAISMLRSMHGPVPTADLYLAAQQRAVLQQQQQAQAQAQAGYAIGCMIAGGCPLQAQRVLPTYGGRTYGLRQFWWSAGNQMCRYEDGSVLNVGSGSCPANVTANR